MVLAGAVANPRTSDRCLAIRRLVRSLSPMGLFRTEDGRVEATSLGLLLAEGPGSARDIALFWMETHYAPFGEFLHTAMTGEDAAAHYYGMGFMDWSASSPATPRYRPGPWPASRRA